MHRQHHAWLLSAATVALLVLVSGAPARAHDIPNDVTIQTFVKADGQRLRLLVRVPLVAMRDMDYPRRGGANSGLLDLARAEASLRDAATLWVADDIELYEDAVRLAYPTVTDVRASLPSDRSFASYDEALAHVTGPPLSNDTEFQWAQGLLDILFEYPIQSERSRFSIRPRLARLGIRTLTVVKFLPPGGAVRAFEFYGDPGLVRLDPAWHQAAWQFVTLGFFHILDGTDHLLFLLCLVIPFRRFWRIAAVATAFTLAHSITLFGAAYSFAPDALWFPPLVETLVAASIVYLALENIVGTSLAFSASAVFKRRWIVAFGFGLVHGFGFSFGLRQTMQFAGSHLVTSLLSFNVGVELSQLLVVLLLIPALGLLFRFVLPERMGTIILSALVAHTAWHWLMDRWDVLRRFNVEWPAIDAAFMASAMRWMMLLVVAAGLYWLVFGVLGTRSDPRASQSSTP